MHLVLVTALIAVCGADKLDRTYLPPASASTAGGSPGSLQAPFKNFNQGLGGLPKGSYSNDFEGVVVDAAAPGTRASGADETGLGAPRIVYGSTDSKVGEAAFTSDAAFPRVGINSGPNTQGAFGAANSVPQNFESRPERIQASRDRASNTVKYENDVSPDRFNYAFETDNGIVAEENGVEVNGVKAEGGYSYTGDDGQVYSVTYTADADGYRPKGDHLPTPPPIPAEILESLEKNAQDEAAGIIDDGSYDAQKYNTGEDYTKTDKEQYNGKPTQYGYNPQSDAVASGSFVSQNNQGFVRPSSQQFGSTSSLDSSKNVPSNENNFGVTNCANNQAQNTQTFGFGAASNNEYLPPSNNGNENRRPALSGIQGIQYDAQSGFPNHSPNANSGFDKNQNSAVPAFIPLAQQKLQEDKPKRPQPNSPIFGKPTVIDSTLSIKDPFGKRPSSNRFTHNKQPNQRPIGGTFEVVSGNVYSSKNEYLPPRRQSNKPNINSGNQQFQSSNSETQHNRQNTNSQQFIPNTASASAFASASRPSSGFQSSQIHNDQLIPQYTGSNLFNQGNQHSNSRPVSEDQSSLSTGFSKLPSFSVAPVSQFQNRPSKFSSQTPTSQPHSELSTPLESNSGQNRGNTPAPVIGGPDSSHQEGSSRLPSFGTQPSNNFLGQYSFNSNKIQQASPTQASATVVSTLSDQSIMTGSENAPAFGRPVHNLNPHSLSNISPVSEQYSLSTQRPGFNQFSQQQGPDDSYYYNKPSRPFNTPTPRPQSSIFPSAPFDQSFKVTQAPFGNKPQTSNAPGAFFMPQINTSAGSTRYPSAIEPISPTLATQQDEPIGNAFQTQFNKVTQASTSSFPSPAPTTSADVYRNQFGQFDKKPLQTVDRLSQGNQGHNQQDSPKPQQQYGGGIYEYKKPIQTLSTEQNMPPSGQFGPSSQFSSSQTTSQVQSEPATYKPGSQFGPQFTQQPFGQRPQTSHNNSPIQTYQKPGQFNSQPSNPSQNAQPIQGASKFPPTYNQPAPSCCKQIGSPNQSTQADEQDETPQFSSQFRPNQDVSQQGTDQGTKPVQSVSTFAGVAESFGGPRKPPSFDKTGYHY